MSRVLHKTAWYVGTRMTPGACKQHGSTEERDTGNQGWVTGMDRPLKAPKEGGYFSLQNRLMINHNRCPLALPLSPGPWGTAQKERGKTPN